MLRLKLPIAVIVLIAMGIAGYLFFSGGDAPVPAASVPAPAVQQEQAKAPAATPAVPAAPSVQPAQSVPVSNAGDAAPTEYWTKRCNETTPSYCEVFQRLVMSENNERLIEFAVGYPETQSDAQAVIVLPLGIVMTDGILLKLDDGAPSKAMVRTCNQAGCFIVMNLPNDFITSMQSAKKITVTFMNADANPVTIELSLEGFAEKLAGLKSSK